MIKKFESPADAAFVGAIEANPISLRDHPSTGRTAFKLEHRAAR